MPIYLFENPKTGEIKEVVQKMNEDHIYSEDGVEWKRIFTIPNASIDVMDSDPYSKDAFMKKTNRNMTVGDMWDISQEMSEKRIQKDGKDYIKENSIKKYEKKTKKDHPLKEGNVFKTKHFSA